MSGYGRNAELSRGAIIVAAGGALVAMSQRAPDLAYGNAGKMVLAVGGIAIVIGLVVAVRSLLRRSGGADQ